MGAGFSSHSQKNHSSFAADDEHGTPPQKRRRLSSPELFDVDTLIASPNASDTRPTLRIEVYKVFHKESKKVKTSQAAVAPRDVLTCRGSCRITIFDVSTSHPRVLHCQSQICDIVTYKNPVGPHRVARVDMPTPFYVPEDSILINRLDDGSHDMSEAYKLLVELEAAKDGQWPPLDHHDFGISLGEPSAFSGSTKRHWVMKSEFESVFGRNRSPLSLAPGYSPNDTARQTDYVMDVALRRTTGFRAMKRIEKGSKPCITAIDPDTEFLNAHVEPAMDIETNGINGFIHEDSPHEHDEELDGDQTPSRSLRIREKNKVYNLKVLSDQAQGKERKRRARAGQAAAMEGRVAYLVPADQPICLDYFRCITCGVQHPSLAHLKVHFQTEHTDLEYAFEVTSQGPTFRVTRDLESVSTPTKTYQLGLPVKPFNIDSFAAGDHSWITSRIGPDNNEEPLQSPGLKPAAARQLFDKPVPKSSQPIPHQITMPEKKKVFVPDTNEPLYDPVSKARLKPGDEISKKRVDNSWLLQKHHESIGEYSDVEPAEKEYIRRWDRFMLEQNLTVVAYFPRAWLAFVGENASWLAAGKHRMYEFGKHKSVLLARDVLNDEVIEAAFRLINAARAKVKGSSQVQVNGYENGHTIEAAPKQSPRASHIRRGANGCKICRLPVQGPRTLICANKACSHRLYHSDCIRADATTDVAVRRWLCNDCSALPASS